MSERIGSGKTDPNFIKDAISDLAKADMTGKNTTETHKSTTIIETKVEGAGKAEKELKKVTTAAQNAEKAAAAAARALSALNTHLTDKEKGKSAMWRTSFFNSKQGAKEKLSDYLEVYSSLQADYDIKQEKAKKLQSEVNPLLKKQKAGTLTKKEGTHLKNIQPQLQTAKEQMEQLQQEITNYSSLIQSSLSALEALSGDNYSLDSLMTEINGLSSFLEKNGRVEKRGRTVADFKKTFDTIGRAARYKPKSTLKAITQAGSQMGDAFEDPLLQDEFIEGYTAIARDYRNTFREYVSSMIAAKEKAKGKLFSGGTMPKAEQQEGIKAGYGAQVQQSILFDFADYIKKTKSYKKNSSGEERAILLKDFQMIGDELIGSNGHVDVASAIKEFEPDTLVHTHQFDSSVDNLRFSMDDLQTMIASRVKQMILLCGEEMLTLDMQDIPKEKLPDFYQDIIGMYNAVGASFGAELKKMEDGSYISDVDTLPKEVQSQVTAMYNQLLSQYAQKYGGQLFIERQDKSDPEDARWIPSREGALVTQEAFNHTQRYLEALGSTTNLDEAVTKLKELQKIDNLIPGIPKAKEQIDKVTQALAEETQQAEQAEQANKKVFESLTKEQLREQLDKEFESFELPIEPDWEALDKENGIPKNPLAKTRPKKLLSLMKSKKIQNGVDLSLEKALMARDEGDEEGYERAKKSYMYYKKVQEHYRDELLKAQGINQTAEAHEKAAQAAEKHANAEKKVAENAKAEENSLDAVKRIIQENEDKYATPMDKLFDKYGISEENGRDIDFLKKKISEAREIKATGLGRAKQSYEWAQGKNIDPLRVKPFREGIQQYIDATNLIQRLQAQISSIGDSQSSQSVEAQAEAHQHAAETAQQHAEAEKQVVEAESAEQSVIDTTNQSATSHEEATKAAEQHAEAEKQVVEAEKQVVEEAQKIRTAAELGIKSDIDLEKHLRKTKNDYALLSSEESIGRYVGSKIDTSKTLSEKNSIYRNAMDNADRDATDYSILAFEELSKNGETSRYKELATAYLNAAQAASELRKKVQEIADEEARITEEKARQERASKTIEDIEALIQERKNHYDVGDLTHAIGPYQDSDFQAKSITTRKHAYNAALDEALNDQSNALSNVFMEYQANGFTAEFDELAIKYTSVSKAVEEFRRQLAILAEQEKQEAETAKQAEEARQREAEKAKQAAEAAKQQTQEKEKQAEAEKKVTAEKQKQQTAQPTPPSSGTPSGSSSSSQVSPATLDSYKQEKQILTEIYTLEKNLIGASGEKERALLRAKTLREQEAKALRDQRKTDGLYNKNETMKLAAWAKEQKRKVDLGKELANAKLAEKATVDRENRLAKIRKEHADALVKAQKDQELVTKKVEKAEISERDKQVKASYDKEKKYLIELNRLRMESIKTKSKEEDAVNKKQIDATQKQIELLRQQRKAEELIDSDREKQLLQSQSASEDQYRKKLIDNYNYRLGNVEPWINGLSNYEFIGEKAHEYVSIISDLQKRMSEVNSLSQNINWGDTASVEKLHRALVELEQDYQTFSKTLATGEGVKANQDAVNKLTASITTYQQKNTKLTAEEVNELNNMKNALKECDQMTLDNISTQFDQFKAKVKSAGREGISFTTQLGKKFREMTTYFMSFASFYRVIGIFRDGLSIIKQLDDALTEMQKVSDESLSSLQKYQVESYEIANSAGTTGLVIQQSTADFMRLGQSLEEASESAKNASILLNVSEFENISDATDSLIAMHAAFDDVAQDDIIDKLNNVGNNYAISTDGLATALQSSASALRTAGNDIDESIAVITAGNQVVQDPSKVGNAARFIALRITGTEEAKEELQNMGEEVDDFVVQTSAKSQKIIKDYTAVASNAFKGVDILDENGNFKSTYQILQEIADVYEEIVETDKKYGTNRSQGLIEALGGKNRANVVASILQSPDVLRNAYESSQNSFGSAEEELEKYKDSISGHIAEIQNKWQQAWANTANRDQINFFIDMGSAVMDLVNKIGLLPSAVVGLTAVYGTLGVALKKDTNIITLLTSAFQGLGKTAFTIGKDVSEAATVTKSLIEIEDELDDAVEMAADGFMIAGESGAAAASAITIPWWGVLAAIAAVTAGIFIAKKAYDEFSMSTDALVKRNDRLIKEDKEKIKSLQDEKKSYDDNAKTLSDLLSQYQEATVGSEEYYNIRQQIADQFPELIVGYNSEGQAIIATNKQIQNQIDEYKELSKKKSLALKEQARENINREIGVSDRSGIKIAGQEYGNEAFSDLVSQRRKLEKELNQVNHKISKQEFVTDKEKYDYRGNNAVIRQGMADAVTESELTAERTRILNELGELNSQLSEEESSLRENYSMLVEDIDEGNEEFTQALSQLEDIAAKTGMLPAQFTGSVEKLKKASLSGEGSVTEALNNVLNPDLSTIKASEYRATMSKYVDQVADMFNLTEEQVNNLRSQADISKNADLIEQTRTDIIDESYSKAAEKGRGKEFINYMNEATAAQVMGFDFEDWNTEQYSKDIINQYSDLINEVKGKTVSELKNKDFTDPVRLETQQALNDALQMWNADSKAAKELGAELGRTVFGNIDLNNREILKDSEGYIETVLGAWGNFGEQGIPIAFSPLLQTGTGTPIDMNNSQELWNYLDAVVNKAGGDPQKIFEIDKEGLEGFKFQGTQIKGLIADVGETAEHTAETMHFLGKDGALALDQREVEKLSHLLSEMPVSQMNELVAALQAEGVEVNNAADALQWLAEQGIVVDDSVEGMQAAFTAFTTDFENNMTKVSTASEKVKSALSEQTSQGYISADTYKELIEANSNYKDAIIETATGIQLNTDKVKELQKQEQQTITKQLSNELKDLYKQYINNEQSLADYNQQLQNHEYANEKEKESIVNQIASLNESQAVLQDNIATWGLYRDQLLAATNAWNEWQTAQSTANASDPYKSMKSAWDSFEEAHKQGWVGTDDYLSYARLLTGVTDEDALMSDKLFEQAKKTQERYFTDSVQGIANFLDDAKAMLEQNGLSDWFTEEGGLLIKNDELFTSLFSEYMQGKGMAGMSLEGVQQLLSAVQDAGWGNPEEWGTYADQVSYIKDTISWMEEQQAALDETDPKWQKYAEMIANTNEQLAELEIKQKQFKTPKEIQDLNEKANEGAQTQVSMPTTFASAEQAQGTLTELLQQKAEIDVGLNPDSYDACIAEIEYVTAQKMDLERPVTIDVSANGLSEIEQQAGDLINKIQEAKKVEQIAFNTGDSATASAAQETGNAAARELQKLQQEHPELEIGIKIQEGTMDEVYGQLQAHQEDVQKAFNIDASVLAPVQKAYEQLGGNIDTTKGKAKELGTQISSTPSVGSLGFPSLQGYITSSNIALGNLKSNLDAINGKTYTANVKVNAPNNSILQGAHQSQGTTKFHPFGRAAASGDMGAKKTETALVGELGPEMRVRGSRWELLGENGAEFANVRKGDIIFNHKQTEELLRNGYISSRGQMAFVGGTAFAGETNWQNSDNYKRVKGKTDSGTKKTKDNTKTKTKTKDSDKDTKSKESDFKKWLDKLFDWIEVKIDRLQKKIDISTKKAEMLTDMIPATLDRITTGANGLFDANRYKETADEVARYVAKAIEQYTSALSSTYSQISTQNQAVTKYESLASTARKKGLSGLSSKNKKTAKKALKILDKDGTIDVSKYNDKVKEVIEGVKQWKDKAIEARAAINDLNDKVRDYVKSLKETVDAQRDAHTSLAEWSVSSVNATFEATNDNNADYSKSRLDLENNQLMVQNKAYAQATSTMSGQVTSIGKTASKVGMYDGLSKKQQKAIKKDKKGKSKYEKALKNAKDAIKAQKEISLSDLDTIQKYNPTVYAKMIAWNEALNQLDITRQEEITAYTQNYNKIAENIVEKYNKMDEATNNDIELYTKQIDNATSDKGKNKLLQDQINKSQELRSHAQSRVTEFSGLKGESASAINKYNAKSIRTSKYMNNSDSSTINALFNRIQSTVNSGKAISASDLNTVFELYRKGYIQAGYYQACTNWNISIERYEEAKRAQQLVEETVRQENATRELQKIQNIQQQSENNRQMNEQRKTEANARISKAEAYGHYAKPEDYTAQIEKENSNLQDLITKREEARKVLEKSIKAGTIRIGDDEWYEAVNVINGMTNAINEADLNVKNLNNSLRQLDWDIFDDGMKEIAKLNKEIEHYLNIIGNEQFFDEDDRGNITQYGLAALEAHNTAYELNIQQAQKYAQEVEELQKRFKLAKEDENWLDSTDAKNQERLQELLEQEWQLVEATEAEKQAIIGLVKQGYDAQLSALNTSISKYKELKQAEKDAYDYQKKITDQTKNILSLEKQLAAFEANSSAESVATVQKLRADLDEAKQQVKDDQYDMYMSEMNNMLDDLSNNFQEWIDYYMKDRDRVLNDAKEYLAGSIDDLGNRSGMADAITTFRNQAIELIGDTGTDVTNISNNLTPMLEANQSVEEKTKTIKEKVDTIIDDFEKMVAKQNQPLINELKQLVAVAEGETKYRAEQAEAEKRAAEEAKRKEEEARKAAEAAAKKAADDKAKADAEAKAKANAQKTTQKTSSNATTIASIEERLAQIMAENNKLNKKALTGKLTSKEKQTVKNNEAEYAKLIKQLEELKKNTKATAAIANLGTKATITAVKATVPTVSGGATAALMSASAKLGYKKGSRRISENQWAWTQEDGTEAIYRKSDNALLTPLGAGDKVFTAGMTDNLWKLAKMNLPEMISNSFKQPIVSSSNTNARTNGGDVQFIFNLPGVKDYDSFKSALIADKSFQNAVQTMTLGAASGKNSLSKFKYS